MKMVDAGHKSDVESQISPNEDKNKIFYPSIYLDKYPEELKDKEIGSVCRLEIEVKVTGRSMREGKDGKKENIDLDVMKIGYISDGGKKTRDEYMSMNDKEREDYDRSQLGSDEDA